MLQITVVHTISPEVIELLKGLFKHGTEAAPSVPAVTQQPAAAEKPVEAKPKAKATPAVKKDAPDVDTLPPFDPEAHVKDLASTITGIFEVATGKALLKDFPVENQHGVSDFEKQETPTEPAVPPVVVDFEYTWKDPRTEQETPAATGKAYTLEEVRAAAVAKTREGDAKRDAVKALITEYGATAISTLDKEKYSLFMQKLNAI